jgi:hypothetical protein
MANIPTEILEEAEKRGLDWMCTGGGCDYICRTVDSHGQKLNELVLSSSEDFAMNPDTLDEPATVAIYGPKDLDWTEGVYMDFPNVRVAMEFMKNPTRIWIFIRYNQEWNGFHFT